jgi:hypothetical protein
VAVVEDMEPRRRCKPRVSRTPSFSSPSVGRPASRPSGGGSRPGSGSQVGSRPSSQPGRSRPNISPGGGARPLPSTGIKPIGGGSRPIASTRPDGGRRGGASTLPAIGAGVAAGAAIGNRIGDRQTNLPGLGDRRPSAGQVPAGERRTNCRTDQWPRRMRWYERPNLLPERTGIRFMMAGRTDARNSKRLARPSTKSAKTGMTGMTITTLVWRLVSGLGPGIGGADYLWDDYLRRRPSA